MNADDRYLFDLTGYLVLKDVLTAEEVAATQRRHRPPPRPYERDRPPAVRRLEDDARHLAAQRPRRYARLGSALVRAVSQAAWYTLVSNPISKKSWAGGIASTTGRG